MVEPASKRYGPVLVGMRGSGKSAVAPLVAARLRMGCIDADEELERRVGRTITEIFNTQGELYFRDVEGVLLLELLQQPEQVIAAGGGAVLYPDVRRLLLRRPVVWLHAEIAILSDRIAGSERPSLTGRSIEQELTTIFAARRSLYEQVATIRLDTGNLTATEVARLVVRFWLESGFGRGWSPPGAEESGHGHVNVDGLETDDMEVEI